eukprot:1415049-Rhodomonas_salina.1
MERRERDLIGMAVDEDKLRQWKHLQQQRDLRGGGGGGWRRMEDGGGWKRMEDGGGWRRTREEGREEGEREVRAEGE